MMENRGEKQLFLTFHVGFWIPIICPNLNLNCSNVLDLRNLQEQIKKAFCFKYCSDVLLFEWIVLMISILQTSALNFKFFSITRTFFFSQKARIILETKYYTTTIWLILLCKNQFNLSENLFVTEGHNSVSRRSPIEGVSVI